MFQRVLPPSFWGGSESEAPLKDAGLIGAAFAGLADARAGRRGATGPRPGHPARPRGESTPAPTLAAALRQAELFPLAGAEVEKILVIQPDHIPARLFRAEQAIADRRFDAARADLAVVLGHPGLEDYVRGYDRLAQPPPGHHPALPDGGPAR